MSREAELLADAMELPPSEREAFLDRECRGDDQLRARIEALIAGAGEIGDFLEPSAVSLRSGLEKPGDVIGRYTLLEKIGEGGCGVVWRARQSEPVRRDVALKVIKLGMDTREVITRFEAERQALALMDHPNIAQVFDGGATGAGRPFFVMELVRGVPITRYCDEAKLSATGRLELFIDVCHAVQHAHQKGIIHRDLKPSNILVTVHDAVAVPKVIDFGIAKATQGRLTDETVFTAFEQFIGTPAYMSPEQAAFNALDVDTRSDVYSLGVLLYELLTGQPPFDPKSLVAGGLEEVRRVIREVDPPRPSICLSTLGQDECVTRAQRRGVAATQLSVLVEGDLDWIVMKCLEKSRVRRYETASALALDLQRHMRHEPVVACPPSRAYLLQKLVRRHRLAFAATAAVAAVLVLGATVSTWLAIRATTAEREQSQLRQAAQDARSAESTLRESAQAQELAARRRAYASDMNLVQQAIADENLGRARLLLDRHRPQPGSPDLRDWEWRYLWQFRQSDSHTVFAQQFSSGFSSITASADGKWLASVPDPALWNLETGAREEIPVGKGINRVAFSPRRPLLALAAAATVARPCQVMLWNLATRQIEQTLILGARDDVCTGLVFAADGETLATCTSGGKNEIVLWRVAAGEKLRTIATGPTTELDQYRPFDVSPDFRLAAYASFGDARIHVCDLTTGRTLWEAAGAEEQVLALRFSPDGSVLASAEGFRQSSIRLWDTGSGSELDRLDGNRRFVSDLVFWPDGKTLASAGGDRTVRLWDLPGRRLSHTFRGHTRESYCLVLLPDNQTLVSGSKDGQLLRWDTKAAPASPEVITIPGVMAWSFSGDGRAIVTVEPNGRVVEHRGANYAHERTLLQLAVTPGSTIQPAERLIAVVAKSGWVAPTSGATILAGDSPWLAHVAAEGNIEVWNWERGVRVNVIPVEHDDERLLPVEFSRGSKSLMLCRHRPGRGVTREEWETESGRRLRAWDRRGPLVAISPDQRYFIATAREEAIVRIDVETGAEQRLELDVRNALRPRSYSWDGAFFAVPTYDGLVHVVNVDPLRHVTTLSGYLQSVHSAVFSPDARRLATGSANGEAMLIWDLASSERVLALQVDASMFRQASFSRDGAVLGAVGGFHPRTTLYLWRAPSWEEIAAAEK